METGIGLIELLRPYGMEVSYPDGATVVARGEEGRAFYVITSGSVDVRTNDDLGNTLESRRLEPGDFFGEVSLLTGAAFTADVTARVPSEVLLVPRDSFFSAMGNSSELAGIITRGLAHHLSGREDASLQLHRQQRVINTLMGESINKEPLFTLSPSMAPIERFLERQEQDRANAVLIYGGAGAGKVHLASAIHREWFDENAPLVVVDCRSFCCEEIGSILFGPPSKPTGKSCGKAVGSAGTFGAIHLASSGTLLLKHIDALSIPFQEALAHHISSGGPNGISRQRQVICTTRKSPKELEVEGLVHPRLADLVEGSILRMPSLYERRRDILPLALYFLQRCEGHGSFTFTAGAEKKLLSSEYGYRNVTELREAIEEATQVADGVQIGAEHIFLGPREAGPARDFAVSRSPFLRRLTSPGAVTSGRVVTFLFFVTIVAMSLIKPGSAEGRFANALIWSLWEPLLFLSFFAFGRVWCTLCPLSSAGRLLRRLKHFDRAPPEWLKDKTGLVLVATFAAIIWGEHYFDMLQKPLPSGFLLLLLLLAAMLFAILYQREAWCQYTCPLGGLGAALGNSGVFTVKMNRHICANYCATHECHKGTDRTPGCPSGRHPLQVTEAHTCKLCLSCLRNCPHGAAKLYIRPPLTGTWRLGDLGKPIVVFGLFLFFFAPAMLASQGTTWASTTAGFAITTLAAVLFALVSSRWASLMLEGYTASRHTLLSRIALSLVVLAWGPAMAYQLRHVSGLSTVVFHIRDGASPLLHAPEIPVLAMAQVFFIVLAAVFSAICFWRIRHETSAFLFTAWDLGWKALALVCFFYVFFCILLVLPLPG